MYGVQAETLQRFTRVETTVVGMNEKLDRAIAANETATEALGETKTEEVNEYKQIKESGKFIDEELWDKRLQSTQNLINLKTEELKQINEALETLK